MCECHAATVMTLLVWPGLRVKQLITCATPTGRVVVVAAQAAAAEVEAAAGEACVCSVYACPVLRVLREFTKRALFTACCLLRVACVLLAVCCVLCAARCSSPSPLQEHLAVVARLAPHRGGHDRLWAFRFNRLGKSWS